MRMESSLPMLSLLRVALPQAVPARRRIVSLATLGTVLVLLTGAAPSLARTSAVAPATHIVQFQAEVSQREQAKLVRAAGGRPDTPVPLIGGMVARLSARAAAPPASDDRVRAVSRNGRVAPQAGRIDASALATAYPSTVMAP